MEIGVWRNVDKLFREETPLQMLKEGIPDYYEHLKQKMSEATVVFCSAPSAEVFALGWMFGLTDAARAEQEGFAATRTDGTHLFPGLMKRLGLEDFQPVGGPYGVQCVHFTQRGPLGWISDLRLPVPPRRSGCSLEQARKTMALGLLTEDASFMEHIFSRLKANSEP